MYTICFVNGYRYTYYAGNLLSISKDSWTLTIV